MLSIRLGDQVRSFRRLSRRDFGTLIERMPKDADDKARLVSAFAVHEWAQTVDGAATIIAVASLPATHSPDQLDERFAEVVIDESDDAARPWGSLTAQITVASIITAESLTYGDRKDGAAAPEGKKRADPTRTGATTPAKRSGWLGTVRGWATRGR